jgi:hypothetical protein
MPSFWPRQTAVAACALLSAALLGACSSEHIVVGEQCPSPYSGHATTAGDAGQAALYGTSCATQGSTPCRGPVRLDKRGCPVYVTFDSCGGAICLGDQLVPLPPDAGMAGEDAGREEDAGAH